MRGIVTGAAMIVCASSAGAQDYPDLRGTWTGTVEAVRAQPEATNVMGEGTPTLTLVEIPAEVVIDQQDGRRFVGTASGETWSNPFVGVIASDGSLLWAEQDGIVQARLLEDGTLDYCYLEASDLRQLAACATLTRQ